MKSRNPGGKSEPKSGATNYDIVIHHLSQVKVVAMVIPAFVTLNYVDNAV